MFSESLLFKEEHEVKAQNIVDVLPKAGSIICIYGESGTGKSEVAWWLLRKLYKNNVTAYVMNLDRFYLVGKDDRTKHRMETGVIGWAEMNWTRIHDELYTFHKNSKFDYLIVEGLYAGYIKYSDCFKVFIRANDSYEFRKLRGKENPDDDWRKYVLMNEGKDVLGSKDRADLII